MSEYPKAKYRKAGAGEGDIKQQYSMERHPYVTALVKNFEEEEKLGKGWFDRPELALAEPSPVAKYIDSAAEHIADPLDEEYVKEVKLFRPAKVK